MLDAAAHGLRNDIATLHMATSLVDDAEIAASMAQAVADLRVRLERMVVAARIELGKRPDDVTIPVDELLRLGAARARREGADPTDESLARITIGGETITGPGPWLERLVADAVHGDDDAWLALLARACGATVDQSGVRLP